MEAPDYQIVIDTRRNSKKEYVIDFPSVKGKNVSTPREWDEESRDDGGHEKQATETKPMEISVVESNRSLHVELSTSNLQSPSLGCDVQSESLQSLRLEHLNKNRMQLSKQVSELKKKLEYMQKESVRERSNHLMKKRQLAVHIEMLQEDKLFLLEKNDKLGKKLLSLHKQKIKLMEEGSMEHK